MGFEPFEERYLTRRWPCLVIGPPYFSISHRPFGGSVCISSVRNWYNAVTTYITMSLWAKCVSLSVDTGMQHCDIVFNAPFHLPKG